MGRALLAALLAVGFLRPVEKRVRVEETADEQVLADLCRQPGTRVELRTRSNMLTSLAVDALRRCDHPRVLLRPPLQRAHRERLERLPQAEPTFELREGEQLDWAELGRLGPRRLNVRIFGPLTPERAEQLGRLRNVTLELDLRGRLPEAEELSRWRALVHAERALRLGADAPPELVAGLKVLSPAEVVVEAHDNRLPGPLLAALAQADLPTRIALTWPVSPSDLEPLSAIRRLSLEVELGGPEFLPRGFAQAFSPLGPPKGPPAPPDGGFDEALPGSPDAGRPGR